MPQEQIRSDGATVWEYLALHDPLPPRADVIIGFGHFDPAVPQRCCELYRRGVAPRVVYTGGRGAGSADLTVPEAQFFAEQSEGIVPAEAMVCECCSTNTGENVRLTAPLLEQHTVRSAILVATPYRQRRVWLTCRRHLRGITLYNAPPEGGLQQYRDLFRSTNQNLERLMVEELERFEPYAWKGYMAAECVPAEVARACRNIMTGGTQ